MALITIVALLFGACSSQDAAQVEEQPARVRAAVTTSGPSTPPIATTGIVTNKEETRLSFKVTGVIQRIAVQEGQPVKAGQRLAEIELTEIDAQVAQARLANEKAMRDAARGEKLAAERLISQQQLQDLSTQAQLARSQLQSVEFNRLHSVITAPGDGVVLRRLAEERELVPAAQPVLILGLSNSGYVVRVALADREIVRVRLDDAATIRMDAYPDQTFQGTVAEIARAADERTGLFPVEIRFDPGAFQLSSGLVARIEFDTDTARSSRRTYVPIAAVIEGDGDRASVFVVDGDIARRRDIRIAFFAPTAVALEEGLQPGERVVTEGALYLEDGDRIEIQTPHPDPLPASGERE
jgi:RND family efflux transporter MFP subunit